MAKDKVYEFIQREFRREIIIVNETLKLTYGSLIELLRKFVSEQEHQSADTKDRTKGDD